MTRKLVVMMLLSVCLMACASSDNFAPVADVSSYEPIPKSGVYRVSAHDTLYSIAWRYGWDYQVLANKNGIAPPYSIQPGQLIYFSGKHKQPGVRVVLKPEPIRVKQAKLHKPTSVVRSPKMIDNREPEFTAANWRWPAHGILLAAFSNRNKGVDIGAAKGAPVLAALSGKVVYAGNGLRGYGNLIILKHNSQYLSAYAYNSRLFVTEGEWVKGGQKIAAMGLGPNQRAALHFEIRKAGKPINPLNLL